MKVSTTNSLAKYQVKERTYLPQNFKLSVWSKLKPYYVELENRPITSVQELEKWILEWCELSDVVAEEFRWRYIRFSCNNEDKKAVESYNYAVQELSPRMSPYSDALNRKLIDCPFTAELNEGEYSIFLRSIQNAIDLYREENVSLASEVKIRSKDHGRIFSKIMLEVEGEEMTIQQARTLMEASDRPLREKIYHQIGHKILQYADELDGVFDDLLQMRHELALNAGFKNYRDFKFQSLGRFDYKVQDCLDFHDSIASEIVPIIDELNAIRKKELGVETLRPWDTVIDISGDKPTRPFNSTNELIEKASASLRNLHPLFGDVLKLMQERGHLDLESRRGKRPGGYNMPLPISGIPFIFMNAANSIKDIRTMMHETGHAVHSYLISDYSLSSAKNLPSEIAELAAMTMELFSLDYWDLFYDDKESLRRAKIWQLEKVLMTLPWVATIDKFQHWLYIKHDHSSAQREAEWMKIFQEFDGELLNWEGLEEYVKYLWHRQLHVFEVPFYYIEYGMAQLGAIAIWRQYRENPKQAIDNYIHALSLGYTKSIPEIYEAAGIEFNFSKAYVSELGAFVKQELEKLIFQ